MTPGDELQLIRSALERGQRVRLEVRGESMRPALRDGQRVEVCPCDRAPRPGDVVACAAAGGLLVHRLLRWTADGLITQGDARGEPDPPLPREALLGVVRRPGGRALPPPRAPRRSLRAAARRLARALRGRG